ncbi:DUF2273 domain-containing protein [Aerococcus kribbianus]|uniref:DUF2273 domain-containing protein n=1 Tax=Aerococcus kribbianus TaxID=2999064 RepID=A0A9X3FNW2_9LACT|nr:MULTISPECIES: DUF2273 domain-containing protein [unclassified Aerococcus]MCZ0717759.1 DUF2273 domain-containing protein [Aerococcus sp. YH-aer221]MCZ0726047.1 DUF2273 domain-containing protein [Aerococcus sp. YH-aer222]
MKQPPKSWYEHRYSVIGLIIAFLFALLWMWLGFGQAVLVALLTAIGYIVGAYFDGEIDLESWFNFFMR